MWPWKKKKNIKIYRCKTCLCRLELEYLYGYYQHPGLVADWYNCLEDFEAYDTEIDFFDGPHEDCRSFFEKPYLWKESSYVALE